MNELTLTQLKTEVRDFVQGLIVIPIPALYDVTDGKAVGTHIEQAFREYLLERYTYILGNAANGIDFPGLGIDIKATSIRQPQSSCPFRDAGQKVYGLVLQPHLYKSISGEAASKAKSPKSWYVTSTHFRSHLTSKMGL